MGEDEVKTEIFYKMFDDVNKKLNDIDEKLVDVVRINEQVKFQSETLAKHSEILDSHSKLLTKNELIKAKQSGGLDVMKEIYKWLFVIASGYILFKMTSG